MISITVHCSDTRPALLNFCIKRLKEFNCDVVLAFDGNIPKLNFKDEWTVFSVLREKGEFFCRANTWNQSIEKCKFDKIIYIDQDRIIKNKFIEMCNYYLSEDCVVFPRNCYCCKNPNDNFDLFQNKDIDFNIKSRSSTIDWDKLDVMNPFSGCTGFTKKLHSKIKPDKRFMGWRFADTDWFFNVYNSNYSFVSVADYDIHLYHPYEVNFDKMSYFYYKNAVLFHEKNLGHVPSWLIEKSKHYGIMTKDTKVLL